MGESKGGRKLYRLSCKSFPILSTLPTTFPPRDLARARKKRSMWFNRNKTKQKKIYVLINL